MKKVINIENAPKAVGCYSQAIISGDFMFISGQIPIDLKTGELVSTSFEVQVRQVLDNINNILITKKLNFNSIVKMSVFLIDLSKAEMINNIFEEYFIEFQPPARSMVEVSSLPKNAQLEIEVIANIHD